MSRAKLFFESGNISLRPFNAHSASDTAYLLCLAKGLSYKTARDIISEYQLYESEYSGDIDAGDLSLNHTASILADRTQVFAENGACDGAEILQYLKDNCGFFKQAGKTIWDIYIECRALLSFDLVADSHWSNKTLDALQSWLEGVRADLESKNVQNVKNLLDLIEAFRKDSFNDELMDDLDTEWRSFVNEFMKKRCSFALVCGYRDESCSSNGKISPLVTPEEIVTKAFGDRDGDTGRPRTRGRRIDVKDGRRNGNDGVLPSSDSSFPGKGSEDRLRWFFEGFPTKQVITKLDRSQGKLNFTNGSIHEIRKAIVLFWFAHYAYLMRVDRAGVNTASHANTKLGNSMLELGNHSYGYDDFVNPYRNVNTRLLECQLAPLYPADPCDMLVMKSIRAGDPAYCEGSVIYDPLRYFNDVVRQSFEIGGDAD